MKYAISLIRAGGKDEQTVAFEATTIADAVEQATKKYPGCTVLKATAKEGQR